MRSNMRKNRNAARRPTKPETSTGRHQCQNGERRMKTDRELSEAAALAAGIELIEIGGCLFFKNSANGDLWNPLADDGAALRLAVKLGLRVHIDNRAGFSWIKGIEGSIPHNGDPYAATRLAIVRAAAERHFSEQRYFQGFNSQ